MSTATDLREIRHAAGVTQAELARRTAIPQPVLSLYESGRRSPRHDAVVSIVEALGHRVVIELAEEQPRPMAPDLVARVLPDLLGLADAIPGRRTGALAFPRLPTRPGRTPTG